MVQKRTIPRGLRTTLIVAGYTVGTIGAFIVAGVVVGLLESALIRLGIPLGGVNPVMYVTLLSVVAYALTLWLVIWLPWKVLRQKTTKKELGLARLPSWTDLALGPASFIPYMIVSSVLLLIVTKLFPVIDIAQKQELGFGAGIFGLDVAVAFLLFVVIAPVIEETLFRGYLYGKLRQRIGVVLSVLLVSVGFGLLHGQVNVGIDTFALSIVLCLLREYTGSIWAGVLLHATKNGLAFYLLFINPSLLSTMGIL